MDWVYLSLFNDSKSKRIYQNYRQYSIVGQSIQKKMTSIKMVNCFVFLHSLQKNNLLMNWCLEGIEFFHILLLLHTLFFDHLCRNWMTRAMNSIVLEIVYVRYGQLLQTSIWHIYFHSIYPREFMYTTRHTFMWTIKLWRNHSFTTILMLSNILFWLLD